MTAVRRLFILAVFALTACGGTDQGDEPSPSRYYEIGYRNGAVLGDQLAFTNAQRACDSLAGTVPMAPTSAQQRELYQGCLDAYNEALP